ncbi:MAG: hypothetical protein PHQ57_06975 [Candidatus Omnitrophica bacterium]|nr:hypothetical protein [Candidatus Omnitrophota bacterium]
MEKQKSFYQVVEEICVEDPRYKADAYEFVLQALHFTQGKLKKEGHVTGKELLGGTRDFVIEQYGPMAKTVLNYWGVTKTQDFGNIVFNMIGRQLLSKTESDSLGDFNNVYDFDSVFGNVLRDTVKDIQ